ncbi:MAG: DUF2306 domain-containing protein, partial [Pirellulaceae bacterium]|nr:DUF2306 domain-containing protein [Pirellulaceae bacterium]
MQSKSESGRLRLLRRMLCWAAALLFAKALLAVLYEYRWYFPPNFDSAFLTGRRESFFGIYSWAFYAHIISGPLTVVLGTYLVLTGGRPRVRAAHRWAGRVQIFVVAAIVAPSGLVMARYAFSGPIAGIAFALLSVATGVTAAVTAWCAITGRLADHQTWAQRCYILLCSPLLLRLVAGFTIVTKIESPWTYRLNAWLSWLVPLAIYEMWRRRTNESTQ